MRQPDESLGQSRTLLLFDSSQLQDYIYVTLTQEELQDMVKRLVATGRKYGMEINIDKSQVMRVSRSNESLQIKVNNELKEVDHFKYLGSVLTRDGYCTRER